MKSIFEYPSFGMTMNERSFSGGNYRFGFNGKEKDNEINVDAGDYDFGSRIYDGRLGRWLSLDPLLMKYPGFSAYTACVNNPIIYVDIDGNDIVIYDEKGAKLATYSKNGLTVEKGQENAPFLKSFQEVRTLTESKMTSENAFLKLQNSSEVVDIRPLSSAPAEVQAKGPQFDPNITENPADGSKPKSYTKNPGGGGTIYWDPNVGLKTTSGGRNSPAMVLVHELFHANRFVNHITNYINGLLRTYVPGDLSYNNMALKGKTNGEEEAVMIQTNEVAKSFPFEDSKREFHGGETYRTMGGVNSTVPAAMDVPCAQDNLSPSNYQPKVIKSPNIIIK